MPAVEDEEERIVDAWLPVLMLAPGPALGGFSGVRPGRSGRTDADSHNPS